MSESKYHLDAHCEAILEEYREHLQEFNESADKVHSLLKKVLPGSWNSRVPNIPP